MQFVLEGIVFGLTLSILLGPIFVVLVQASIEKGASAGLAAALGVWVSDILIVVLALSFMKHISPYIQSNGFVFWFGLLGGLVLLVTGIITSNKRGQIDFTQGNLSAQKLFTFLSKGFLVNTINPFTFIFWISVIGSFVIGRQLNTTETWLFVGTILGTIILTDSLKVFLAKIIRNKIDNKTLTIINRIAGVALVIFGFVLLLRSIVYA